ncbi:nucleotidyltransferase domain-containing protein [Desulfosporosinus hippei]|uniref:Uncharacterized nucleotidyltransferase n=1 Tax=Desulfosporosinus hippei DSM 8344 TaxID=1121419 RepID=A0A1G8H1S2_9FIRM|nr:nucleotidyltransferase family protein [Desulfosporosinus hippei]SDI00574.1 Uncharacterised nucleotidyltransferase [Desulfosporosinus hippei DSM 8344]
MTKTQAQLLSLLKLSINGDAPDNEIFSSLDGEELLMLALQQNVYAFLYSTLNQYRKELNLSEPIMSRWKDYTLHMAIRQLGMLSEIKTILALFESNEIPVISVKGLALKQLYPQPELRNMGDIDLLIREKDISRAIDMLKALDYHPNPKDLNNPRYMHIGMKKMGSFSVELHRTLWHPTIMKTKDDQLWLDHIWQHKRQATMEGWQFSALAPEDELINLIVHLARHVMESDAQLRQLGDIVLFLNRYEKVLDFTYIEQIINLFELSSFYQNLLLTCHDYLGLRLPADSPKVNENKSEVMLKLIFSSLNTLSNNPSESRLSFLSGILAIVKRIPWITRTVRFCRVKAYYQRSIGLYIKY